MSECIRPMGPVEWTLLGVLSLLWGGSFLFAKVAVADIPPLTLVFLRVAIAACVLVPVCRALRHPLPRRGADWLPFAVMGLVNNVIPFTLLFWGMTQVASGLAAILNATTPLFTVLLAHVLTQDERLTRGRLAGVVLGLVGVTALIGFEALGGLAVAVLAQFACVGAALSYAFAGIWGRRLRGGTPTASAAGQLMMSSVLMVPLVLAVDRPWTLAGAAPAAIASTVALAVLSTALAYVIFFRILKTSGATNLLLVTFLTPVSAVALGALVLGERPGPTAFVGMALIGLGLAAIDGRAAATLRARLRASAAGSRRQAP